MSILEVHDVSIRYMTGDFKDIGLKEYVMRKLKGEYRINEFWADRNVTFSLEKGDMLGIIGTNGAGKSTLLKAISGIMEPTGGWVKREGNIAALLELASGFDGELPVPVELPWRCMKMHSDPGALVLDPFCGGAATLIAAEQSGRRCFAMDNDPANCDLAIMRWEQFTGEKAVLIKS